MQNGEEKMDRFSPKTRVDRIRALTASASFLLEEDRRAEAQSEIWDAIDHGAGDALTFARQLFAAALSFLKGGIQVERSPDGADHESDIDMYIARLLVGRDHHGIDDAAGISQQRWVSWLVYSLGNYFKERGELVDANDAFELVSERGVVADRPYAMLGLARILALRDRVEESVSQYARVLETGDPGIISAARCELADELRRLGHGREAEEEYRAVIDSGDESFAPRAKVGLGEVLRERGDHAEAERLFRNAIDSGEIWAAPTARLQLARLYKDQGRIAEAEDLFRDVASSGSKQVTTALIDLGHLLHEESRFDEAEATYQTVIASQDFAKARVGMSYLAFMYVGTGRLHEAEALYRQMIDFNDPERSPEAMVNLGMLLHSQGRTDEAETLFRSAAESRHQRQSAQALRCLEAFLVEQERFAEAESVCRKLIASGAPEYLGYGWLGLGMVLAALGRDEEARVAFREAVGAGPEEVSILASGALIEL